MRKALLPMLAMSLLLAQAAGAQVLMGWGDSPTNGAPTTQVFDCKSNGGASTLVVSLVPPTDIPGVVGFSVDLTAWVGGRAKSPLVAGPTCRRRCRRTGISVPVGAALERSRRALVSRAGPTPIPCSTRWRARRSSRTGPS